MHGRTPARQGGVKEGSCRRNDAQLGWYERDGLEDLILFEQCAISLDWRLEGLEITMG